MKGLAMAGILAAVAAGAALPTEARADWRVGVVIGNRDRDWRDEGRGAGSAFRYGYDRGWRDGSDEGYRDGRRNRDPRFWRDGDFRDADSGYKRWMGPRWEYSRGFREGYSAGYRRAFAAARPSWHGDRYRDDRYDRDRWNRDRNDRGR